MHKDELRKKILLKRKKSFSYSASLQICKSAANLPAFTNANNILIYMSTKKEVDTSYLIAEGYRQGKTLYIPRVIDSHSMKATRYDCNSLQKGAYGIWESVHISDVKLDLIFVPGVVFDHNKNRIGYGKGYYDRFLKETGATTIGLAFSSQIVSELPAEPHDKKLDIILTEEGIIV